MIAVHQKYIATKFFKSLAKVLLVFTCIILIMSLFEEMSFFRDGNESIFIPIFLTLINLPSVLFEIFPFIFLITAINFFIEIIEIEEINTFKTFGITNLKLVKNLSLFTFLSGVIIITLFYGISTNLKFLYLDLKNQYTKDDKYLAVITSNGLWIKDVVREKTKFINAEKIDGENLLNVSISEFDENFNIERSITAKIANIENKNWLLRQVVVNSNNSTKKYQELNFETNFDINKMLSLFDNLSALSLFELETLKKDYQLLGYSTNAIDGYKHKIYSYPVYLTLMTIIGSILMLRIKHNKSKIFHIIFGIIISVIIYYLNFFFNAVIETQDVPYLVSIWGPQIILTIIVLINIIRLNEK